VIIRRVRRDDISSFVEVYISAYRGLEEYAYTRRREIRHYFKWLFARDKEGFMVAEVTEPIAFVACDTNWISFFERKQVGEIHELFVMPDYRDKGVGKFLLEKALEYARERKRDLAELWVGEKNFKAIKFYQSFGFEESGKWGKWMRMIRKL
jgi:ribosomal protein S18 acetylase RimI-like enzyme